ncbi:membrane protein YczE [Kineococcus sp. SYSU DK005]|uniref:membrane protein YczE n=1 Tax=Kineococcus sp. SYSU DK005 TaxID=3383126 RepID=UPI003D7C9364
MSSPLPSGHPQRVLRLAVGLVLYGAAEALMVQAALGVSPWTVFAQGLSRLTGAGLGWVTNAVGLLVLLLWIPLRQRPGAGTVANVLVVGTVIQAVVAVLDPPSSLPARAALFTAGLLLLAVASGLYIGAHYGPGPRDGLMTGLHARTGRPVWQVRTGVEVSVLAVGWALGGDVGPGTLAFAALVGPLVGWTLPVLDVRRAPATA